MGAGKRGTPTLGWINDVSFRCRRTADSSLVAQLFPGTRNEAAPPGVPRDSAVEGAVIDLGPRGQYASLGWEDLAVLMPWVKLKSPGHDDHDGRRSGWGFEAGTEI